jgi:hypothetical protein
MESSSCAQTEFDLGRCTAISGPGVGRSSTVRLGPTTDAPRVREIPDCVPIGANAEPITCELPMPVSGA